MHSLGRHITHLERASMPSTLKEIADLCGVTKQTVKNNLRSLGLWDFHVTAGDVTTPAVVDDEATRRVVAVLTARRRPQTEPPASDDVAEAVRARDALIAELRDRLRDAEAERDRLREQNGALSSQIVAQAETIRALPSPDAVDRAREDGERDGRTEGEADGREAERKRIAEMGFWKRMRYLRGGGGNV